MQKVQGEETEEKPQRTWMVEEGWCGEIDKMQRQVMVGKAFIEISYMLVLRYA
jgi:hypothetical protein